jgi:hypothetical protein
MHALRSWILGSVMLLGAVSLLLIVSAETRAHSLPAAALLTSLVVIALSRPLARAHGIAPAGAMALGALGLAPLVFAASLGVASEPFAVEVAPQGESGAGDIVLFGGLFGFALPVILWRSASALALSLWPRLAAGGVVRPARVVGLLAVIALLLAGVATVRAARHAPSTRPFEAAPVIAEVFPMGAARSSSGVHVHRLEDLTLRARCREGRCTFLARAPSEEAFTVPRELEPGGVPWFSSSERVTVRRWPGGSLWVLIGEHGARAAFRPSESPLPVPVTAAEVAPNLSPPTSWIFVAAAGAALGAWLLGRARAARRAADVDGWCNAILQDDTVTLADDQRTFAMAPGLRPPAGEVIVRRAALGPLGGGYRVDPTLAYDDVRAGTVADLARAADAEAWRALAVAAVGPVLAAAPLLAARVVGLW